MLKIVSSNHFKKDLKLALKRGFPVDRLRDVVNDLASEKLLDPSLRDHELSGNFKGFRECHVLPDFLLIYRIDNVSLSCIFFAAVRIPIFLNTRF